MVENNTKTLIKVLVTDDSSFMRLLITDIVGAHEDIEVVGTAKDGKDAVEKVRDLKPDLLLLDMEMKDYDGLYAIRNIMKSDPLPILILSSTGNTNTARIFEALHCGAVDYINKPEKNSAKIRDIDEALIRKVRLVANAKPKHVDLTDENQKYALPHIFDNNSRYSVIVMGASTGGPSAIEKVIKKLPVNLNVPVIICQHMPQSFIRAFVDRLNALTPLHVIVGEEEMTPLPGTVIIAPAKANMLVTRTKNENIKITFTMEKFADFNYPSINAMMLSAVKAYGERVIGVLLTGMGKDGVEGLKAIKKANGFTIAQDKESCVIYGMPKAAVEQGAVSESMHINEIGNFLVSCLS